MTTKANQIPAHIWGATSDTLSQVFFIVCSTWVSCLELHGRGVV